MSAKFKKIFRFFLLLAIVTVLIILGSIPVKIALTQVQVPHPKAILMLGGNLDRDHLTADFAQKHPNLPLWISVGYRNRSRQIFAKANINPDRLHYNNRATDTVTNFTTMVEPLQKNDIRHVYLITSDYHMARSRAITTIVFGSRGIIITPVEVSSNRKPETKLHIARDVVRSIIWLFTGFTGASLNPRLSTANLDGFIDFPNDGKSLEWGHIT